MVMGILIVILIIVSILYKITRKQLQVMYEKYEEVVHDHRSTQVKHGMSFEQLFPFMENYPYDPRNFRFFGTPIDGISFEEDKVVFVEFKTGNAKLSATQIKIKHLVEKGKVAWVEIRESDKKI